MPLLMFLTLVPLTSVFGSLCFVFRPNMQVPLTCTATYSLTRPCVQRHVNNVKSIFAKPVIGGFERYKSEQNRKENAFEMYCTNSELGLFTYEPNESNELQSMQLFFVNNMLPKIDVRIYNNRSRKSESFSHDTRSESRFLFSTQKSDKQGCYNIHCV